MKIPKFFDNVFIFCAVAIAQCRLNEELLSGIDSFTRFRCRIRKKQQKLKTEEVLKSPESVCLTLSLSGEELGRRRSQHTDCYYGTDKHLWKTTSLSQTRQDHWLLPFYFIASITLFRLQNFSMHSWLLRGNKWLHFDREKLQQKSNLIAWSCLSFLQLSTVNEEQRQSRFYLGLFLEA